MSFYAALLYAAIPLFAISRTVCIVVVSTPNVVSLLWVVVSTPTVAVLVVVMSAWVRVVVWAVTMVCFPLATLTLNDQTVNTDRETYELLKARVTMRWCGVSSETIISVWGYYVDQFLHAHVHTMILTGFVVDQRHILERAHVGFNSKVSNLEWPCPCSTLSMADPNSANSEQWHRMTDAQRDTQILKKLQDTYIRLANEAAETPQVWGFDVNDRPIAHNPTVCLSAVVRQFIRLCYKQMHTCCTKVDEYRDSCHITCAPTHNKRPTEHRRSVRTYDRVCLSIVMSAKHMHTYDAALQVYARHFVLEM